MPPAASNKMDKPANKDILLSMGGTIEVNIPEALARALGGNSTELPQRTLEAATLQQYASGKVTHAQVAEILGLTRWETDALLNKQNVFPPGFNDQFKDDLAQLRKALRK